MGILIKKIGNKEYAYFTYRQGSKVIHKYLGSASKAATDSKIAGLKSEKGIPEKHHIFFWDTDPANINLKVNARYVIERILEIGDMGAFLWLQKIYSGQTILKTLEMSRKISPKSKNFWEIWYGIRDIH